MFKYFFVRIGPLHKELQYDVLADKEGYVLAKEDGEKLVFRAFQLGKVVVKVKSCILF